ncbi:MAG: serine hydrolase domain-containing protein [Gemmatimonadales bacterium]
MATIRSLAIALTTLVLVPSSGLGQSRPYSSADLERLKKDVQAILDEARVPGASIALVTADSVLWAGGLGNADAARAQPVTDSTLFRVGSISKSFTALAVLTLVEQGRLTLDTPIRGLVPTVEFTNRWEGTHPVTVAQLLEHTTGFDDIHFVEIAQDDDPDISLEQGLAFHPHSRISRWPPGTQMSYANAGPTIAGLVLESLSGQKFETYVEAHVLEPLGMVHSTFGFPANPDLLAKGYATDGKTETRYDHILFRPSGALNTSAREMSRYLRMMINRGRLNDLQLFRPETIARMERPMTTLAARAGHDFGYGLGNEASIIAGHVFHGHGGSTTTGFISTYAYSAELGVGYFVSTNLINGKLPAISKRIVDFLAAGRVATKPPAIRLDPAQIPRVAGYYQLATPRSQFLNFLYRFAWLWRVWEEDGRLYRKSLLGGEKTELIPVSEGAFRTEDEPVATLFLVSDDRGTTYLQSGFEGQMRKISALTAWIQPVAAGLALLLMLSSIPFGLVWLAARLLGRMKQVPGAQVWPPFLTSISLFGGLFLAFTNLKDIDDLIRVSVSTLAFFLGPLAFALLSAYLAFRLVRPVPTPVGPVLRNWSRMVSIACIGTAIFLVSEGVIGLRLWAD